MSDGQIISTFAEFAILENILNFEPVWLYLISTLDVRLLIRA